MSRSRRIFCRAFGVDGVSGKPIQGEDESAANELLAAVTAVPISSVINELAAPRPIAGAFGGTVSPPGQSMPPSQFAIT